MAITNIWVVVEPSNGSLTTTSLELLSHARSFGATVSAITWGADSATLAGEAVPARKINFGLALMMYSALNSG